MSAQLDRLVAAITDPDGEPLIEVPAALIDELTEVLTRQGWEATRVDRAPVVDRETLMHALYQAGEFPGSFGFNWDALLDCLSDWSWRPASGHALVFRDFGTLEENAPAIADTFLEVVEDARTERGSPVRVLRLTRAGARPSAPRPSAPRPSSPRRSWPR